MEHRILETDSVNKITVMDEHGAGGACHRYLVTKDHVSLCFVKFQEGPVKEFGVIGCHNEDLLAIVIDRLKSFQAGDYACEENARALRKIEEGLGWLKYRTSDRIRRNVEGTNKK
ncbi:MAG: hypothetical protein IMF11_18985 [Proteobacteria bacterium]|nr:hypothetical protein [Pseudomonadota bacterium]